MKNGKIGITKLVITGVSLFILLSGMGLVAATNSVLGSSDEKSPLFAYRTDSVVGNPTNVKVDYIAKETPSIETDGPTGGSGDQLFAPITSGCICTFIGFCPPPPEPMSDSWDCPGGCIGPRDPNAPPPPTPVRTFGCSTFELDCHTLYPICEPDI
jgi:hypothetical protein